MTPGQEAHGNLEEEDKVKDGGHLRGGREKVYDSRPCLITGLFQDLDLQEEIMVKEGGLTFCPSMEGDIELQENTGESTIPVRYPPISASTLGW